MLTALQQALGELCERSYRFHAAPNTAPPYIVWGEDSANDLAADNGHGEQAWQGTVDLYTKDPEDPMKEGIPAALEGLGASWYFNSFQYEEDTGLLHFEWVWEVV